MIRIKDVVVMKKKQTLLGPLDAVCPGGSIYLVTGREQTEKSALLKLLAGILIPSRGSCVVEGFTPAARHPDFLADTFFLPAECEFSFPSSVAFLSVYAPAYPRFDLPRFNSYLEAFGLERKTSGKDAGKLYLLCFALAAGVKTLLLELPDRELDSLPAEKLSELLLDAHLPDQHIFLTAEDPAFFSRVADRIVVLAEGRILLVGELAELAACFELRFSEDKPVLSDECLFYTGNAVEGYQVLNLADKMQEKEIGFNLLLNGILAAGERIKPFLLTGKEDDEIL